MPPEIGQWALDGGIPGLLLAAAVWFAQRAGKFETERDAERTGRNADALTAFTALHEQKVLNIKAEAAIDRRDDRIADLQRDLDKCERLTNPRPEAAS